MKQNFLALAIISLSIFSCKKSEVAVPEPTIVKEITVNLSAANENPQPAGRNETGTGTIKIYSDNSITVDATVNGMAASDNLTLAHLHVGDPVTNGQVMMDLNPAFTGGTMKSKVTGVRTSFIDTLKAGTVDLYLNLHSTQVGSGLVRGQLFNPITFAVSVNMTGAAEVPAVTTTATGVALLRITADNKMYTKITVSNLESTDALTAGHIHTGAAGVNGPVILGICGSAADFGVSKVYTPSPAVLNSIRTEAVYLNAHSTTRGGGVVRGQIR